MKKPDPRKLVNEAVPGGETPEPPRSPLKLSGKMKTISLNPDHPDSGNYTVKLVLSARQAEIFQEIVRIGGDDLEENSRDPHFDGNSFESGELEEVMEIVARSMDDAGVPYDSDSTAGSHEDIPNEGGGDLPTLEQIQQWKAAIPDVRAAAVMLSQVEFDDRTLQEAAALLTKLYSARTQDDIAAIAAEDDTGVMQSLSLWSQL